MIAKGPSNGDAFTVVVTANSCIPGVGSLNSLVCFITPTTSSVGLLTFGLLMEFLNDSLLKRVFITCLISLEESMKAFDINSIASGSFGGIVSQDGTGISSPIKKLYKCLDIKEAVAGCETMISIISSPSKLPLFPRKTFSS